MKNHMNNSTVYIFAALVVICLVIAPATKVLKHQHVILSTTSEELTLIHKIPTQDLTYLGSFKPANRGPYQVAGYQAKTCAGSIALMPLYRNAEGSYILQKLAENSTRFGIIYQGKIHHTFPQLQFTINQIQQKLNAFISFAPPYLPAIAFAETGECQLAEKMTKTLIL